MTTRSPTQLAEAYVACAATDSEADRWAFDLVMDFTLDKNWEAVWNVLQKIAELQVDIDTETLAIIAAGPLEDLICHAGPMYIDAIEHAVKINRRMGRLLTGVWGESRTDPVVWARVVKFCRAFEEPIDGRYRF